MTIELEDLLCWSQNDNTICTSILEVAQAASTGNTQLTLDLVARSHQLIIQSLKSNHALREDIKQRT